MSNSKEHGTYSTAGQPSIDTLSDRQFILEDQLMRSEQFYRTEIHWRDNEIAALWECLDRQKGSFRTELAKLRRDMLKLRGMLRVEEDDEQGKGEEESASPVQANIKAGHVHTSSITTIRTIETEETGKKATLPRKDSGVEVKEPPLIVDTGSEMFIGTVDGRVFEAEQTFWGLLGFLPVSSECSDGSDAPISIPAELAVPQFSLEVPPYPFEKHMTKLFNNASDPNALPMLEYYNDDRNWPTWALEWMCQDDDEKPKVKARRLIIAMLALQDAWKRAHSFPFGNPRSIECNGVCGLACWTGKDDSACFNRFPTLWGWPDWTVLKAWYSREAILAEQKAQSPGNLGKAQIANEENKKWLEHLAAIENSREVPAPVRGCKYRGGKFYATPEQSLAVGDVVVTRKWP